MRIKQSLVASGLMLALLACASQPVKVAKTSRAPASSASPMLASATTVKTVPEAQRDATAPSDANAMEVVLYALGLLNINYRWGGANPESGLDCSGMVSYIYKQATGVVLPHNAAAMAQLGKEVDRQELSPGDLVFFNTRNKPFSHVGIYIGEDRFVHAPKTNSYIQVSSLKSGYFASRFEAARRYLN